jgi:hypothetical protein
LEGHFGGHGPLPPTDFCPLSLSAAVDPKLAC